MKVYMSMNVEDGTITYSFNSRRQGGGSRASRRWLHASTTPSTDPCLPLFMIPHTITKGEMLVSSGTKFEKFTDLLMTVLSPLQRGEESRGNNRPAQRCMNTPIVSRLQPIAFTHLRVKLLVISVKALHPLPARETCDECKQSTRSTAMRSTGRWTRRLAKSTSSQRQSTFSEWRHHRWRAWRRRRTSRRPSTAPTEEVLARRHLSNAWDTAKLAQRSLERKMHLDAPGGEQSRPWGTDIASHLLGACCGAEHAGITRSSGRTASARRALELLEECMFRGSGDFRKDDILSVVNL